jgi:alpha-amylase/alpha-mannosidase (GH57 family)
MIWANFLHFYQPPTQKPVWVKKITAESYRRLVQGMLEHPEARVTININGILDELLDQNGEGDVLDGLKELLRRGQIELTASAKYHPLLQMLPD